MLARCSLGLAFLVGHALLPLLMMHSLSKLAVQQEYPPQGTFVETHYSPQVLIECKGSGSPTIVFETGLGALRNSSFHMLYAPLENSTRVCWYDRPGYGYSQPVLFQSHQSIQVVSDNLWAVLEAAGEQGPFVLVGHSIAGLYTRNFVMDHAQNVSGLMLIDTSSEYQGGYEKHWGEQVLAEIANLVSPLIPNVNAFFALFGGNMDYRKEDAVHILNDCELRGAFFGEFPAAFVKKRRGIVESDGHECAGELCALFRTGPLFNFKRFTSKGAHYDRGG
ncbi:Alpha/Beta hydrolase protein, partial [Obelidium mucronatum]